MQTIGIGWVTFLNYLNENFTPAQIEKLKSKLDDKAKDLFEKKVIATAWIDYSVYIKILVIADKILGKGDLDLIRQVNYYQARREVKGVLRILVSLLSPHTVIKSSLKLWTQYYDKGKITTVNITNHSVTFKIEDAQDIPLYHDVELEAYFEELMRMAGAKNIKWNNQKCIARGDSYCLSECTWE